MVIKSNQLIRNNTRQELIQMYTPVRISNIMVDYTVRAHYILFIYRIGQRCTVYLRETCTTRIIRIWLLTSGRNTLQVKNVFATGLNIRQDMWSVLVSYHYHWGR